MKILIFLNLGNIPMTEEMLLAKISKIALFHGGVLSQSQDNRSVWIVRTEVSNEYKKHYTKSFWKYFGDGIHELFDNSVYVSIYANNLQKYPKFQDEQNIKCVNRLQEIRFDFSGDDISTDSRFW